MENFTHTADHAHMHISWQTWTTPSTFPVNFPSLDTMVSGGGKRHDQENVVRETAIRRAQELASHIASIEQITATFANSTASLALAKAHSTKQALECLVAAFKRSHFLREAEQVLSLAQAHQHSSAQSTTPFDDNQRRHKTTQPPPGRTTQTSANDSHTPSRVTTTT
eukprot:5402405-Amphidinium_carterae.6